jgi:hypothetical protein
VGWQGHLTQLTGGQAGCAACVPGERHLFFDGNFGMRLLRRQGASLDYAQPLNRQLFISNAHVTERLTEVDRLTHLPAPSEAQGPAPAVPSEQQAPAEAAGAGAQAAAGGSSSAARVAPPPATAAGPADAAGASAAAAAARAQPAPVPLAAGAATGGGGEVAEQQDPPSCSDFRADRLTMRDPRKVRCIVAGSWLQLLKHTTIMQNAQSSCRTCGWGVRHAAAVPHRWARDGGVPPRQPGGPPQHV